MWWLDCRGWALSGVLRALLVLSLCVVVVLRVFPVVVPAVTPGAGLFSRRAGVGCGWLARALCGWIVPRRSPGVSAYWYFPVLFSPSRRVVCFRRACSRWCVTPGAWCSCCSMLAGCFSPGGWCWIALPARSYRWWLVGARFLCAFLLVGGIPPVWGVVVRFTRRVDW